jgi:hypothetical protein
VGLSLTLELVGRGPVEVPPWRVARLAWRDAALAACVVLAGEGAPLEEVRRWTVSRLKEVAAAARGTRLEGVAKVALLYARDHLDRAASGGYLFPSAKRDAFGRVAPVLYGHAWRVAGGVVRDLLGVGRVERPLDLLRGLSSRLADAGRFAEALEGFEEGVVEGWVPPERRGRPEPRRREAPARPEPDPSAFAEVSLSGRAPFEEMEVPARRFVRLVADAVGAPRLAGPDGRFTFDREAYHRRFLRSERVVERLGSAWLTWSSGKRLDPSRPPWGCFAGEEGEPFGAELAEWYAAYGDSL